MFLHPAAFIWLALAFLGLGVSMMQHGQPKTGNHNLGSSLLGTGIIAGLLYWGGFFNAPG